MIWFVDTGCGWTTRRAQAAKANNERDSDPQSPGIPLICVKAAGILAGLPCIAYRNRPANNRVQRTRMRTYTSIAFGLLLLSAACAGPAPLELSAPSGIRPSEAPPMRISAEAEHLRGILAQDVPQRIFLCGNLDRGRPGRGRQCPDSNRASATGDCGRPQLSSTGAMHSAGADKRTVAGHRRQQGLHWPSWAAWLLHHADRRIPAY